MRAVRRSEYAEQRRDVVEEILDSVTFGYVAMVDDEGWPLLRPMNYARMGSRLYFHGSSRGERAERLESPVTFTAVEPLAYIPSNWRHPQMACPATNYFRSVQVRGRLRVVEELDEKARAMQVFMDRYQPGGGFRPLSAEDPMYRGPLAALQVLSLELDAPACKVKVGQNLEPGARRRVFEALLRRDGERDHLTARRMAEVDASLDPAGWLLPRREGDLDIVDDPAAIPADQLKDLLDTTYWAAGRTLERIERLLAGSHLVVGILEGKSLVAFARVISDGATLGWILDVVVRSDRRGRGLGGRLIRLILEHPRLAQATRLGLDTRDAMSFYERFGFGVVGTRNTGPYTSTTMMLQRER